MVFIDHPLRGKIEAPLSRSLAPRLQACVYLPQHTILFFIDTKSLGQLGSRGSMGFLDLKTMGPSSIISRWYPEEVTNVTIIGNWVLACCSTGLYLYSTRTGKSKCVASPQRSNNNDRVVAVAVHGSTITECSIWFSYYNPTKASKGPAKIYSIHKCKLKEWLSDENIRPARLTLSPDGKCLYVACTLNDAIFEYTIQKGSKKLGPKRRLSYSPIDDVSALRTDDKGFIYAACGDTLKCWDRYGQFADSIELSETIKDFIITETGLVVMFDHRWISLVYDPRTAIQPGEREECRRLVGRYSRM